MMHITSIRPQYRILPGVALFATLFCGCDNAEQERKERMEQLAKSQVRTIAEDLDEQTTNTGVYVRIEEDEITDKDPWGTPIEVRYSQGGVAEEVTVRSAGPDKTLRTDDDIVATESSINFKGAGEGIRKGVQDTAANAAKGLVKGTIEGVKEGVKDALPFKRKKKQEEEASEETTADSAETTDDSAETRPEDSQPETDE